VKSDSSLGSVLWVASLKSLDTFFEMLGGTPTELAAPEAIKSEWIEPRAVAMSSSIRLYVLI